MPHSGIKAFLNKIGLGKLTYLGVALKQLMSMSYADAELIIDGGDPIKLRDLVFIAGMNHRFEGGGFMFGPNASDNDGKLDLCVVTGVSKGSVLKIMPKALKGEHFGYDGIEQYHASTYTVKTPAPLWVHTDGEAFGQSVDIQMRISEMKLNLMN